MPKHELLITSPPDREKVVVEIFCDNEHWAEINQESETLQLEIYPRQDGKPWVFSLDEVLLLLNKAKIQLP